MAGKREQESEGMAGVVALEAAASEARMDRRTAAVVASCIEMLRQKEEEIEEQRDRLQEAAEIIDQMETEGQTSAVMQEVHELEEMVEILEKENAELRERYEDLGNTNSLRTAVLAANGVTDALSSQLNKLRKEYNILKEDAAANEAKQKDAFRAAETVAMVLRKELDDVLREREVSVSQPTTFDDDDFFRLAKIYPEDHFAPPSPLRLDLDNFSCLTVGTGLVPPQSSSSTKRRRHASPHPDEDASTVSVGKRHSSANNTPTVPQLSFPSSISSKVSKKVLHLPRPPSSDRRKMHLTVEPELSPKDSDFPVYTPSSSRGRFLTAR